MGGVGPEDEGIEGITPEIAAALTSSATYAFRLQIVTDWGTMFTDPVTIHLPGKMFEVRVFRKAETDREFMFYGAATARRVQTLKLDPVLAEAEAEAIHPLNGDANED